jgi:four helix bundle protein
MKTTFRFERLDVWQDARQMSRTIYRLARSLPRSEEFALGSQLRRAAVSVSSNIAEGSGRNSDADFAHFLEIAYGSAMECASLLYLGLDEGYFKDADVDAALVEIDGVAGRLVMLNRSLKVSASKTPFKRVSSSATAAPRS